MKYHYEEAVRWFKVIGDPRGHVPPKGWTAFAYQCDNHPITGKEFKTPQWWMRETKGISK